jgi:DNA-binding transcriptional MerR regulator
MEKKVDKKRSIGQVGKELNLPDHVIRFWETQFSQIRPKTGKGNRRYYYEKDVQIITRIKYFLYEEGYTIKGLQKLIEKNNNLLLSDEAIELENDSSSNDKKDTLGALKARETNNENNENEDEKKMRLVDKEKLDEISKSIDEIKRDVLNFKNYISSLLD